MEIKTRKVAALSLESAPGLQLWSVLLGQVGSDRSEAYSRKKGKREGKIETDALKRIYKICDSIFTSSYGIQFSFCEESKLMSRIMGCTGEEDDEIEIDADMP